MSYEVLVIGGGINGLSTCYHLVSRGIGPLALLERFTLGHDRGSSHGRSRITRSAYVDVDYVRLMQVAHKESWPRLEREAGRQLVYPTPGCFFGAAGGAYREYERAVGAAGVEVEPLTPPEARRQFPMFRFSDADGVLLDRTAGLLAAGDAMESLARLLRAGGVEIHERTEVRAIDPSRSPVRVVTTAGAFEAERLIITAGAWSGRLVPQLASHLAVARQTVGYFRLAEPREQSAPGVFPVWGYFAGDGDIGFYGLPEFEREGVKIARHITSGVDDDPDSAPEGRPDAAIAELSAFLDARFTSPVERFAGWESCLYTNTATEDFVIDLLPGHPNVVVGAGFSGHGFKFGPLTGRLLAELALDGRSSLPEFEAARSRFAFPGAPQRGGRSVGGS